MIEKMEKICHIDKGPAILLTYGGHRPKGGDKHCLVFGQFNPWIALLSIFDGYTGIYLKGPV